MNRFLRAVLFAISALLVLYAMLFARYYHALGESLLQTKMLWVALALAAGLAFAGWKFSLRARFLVFLLLFTLLIVEGLLQALGWLGVLPGVNTKLKAPYARVYWSIEGRGNSIRNRLGWNYPEFDLQAPHRIAFVGDSQVEAVEVHRTRNQAAILHSLLRQRSPDWSVLGLGSHGSSPAYSIDTIEYAHRHFGTEEAILVVSEGSDLTESSVRFNNTPPERYLYYELGPEGGLQLLPGSEVSRKAFRESLEWSHRSLLFNAPVTLNSHCMILQTATSLRDTLNTRQRQAEIAAQTSRPGDEEYAAFARVGFNPRPFAVEPEPEARRALQVLLAELRRGQEVCATNGMKLRLVLLPAFPKVFYDSQKGRDWSSRVGRYDYLKPEQELAAFARSNSIPVLPLGEYIQARRLDVEEIRSLYLTGGIGHLTEKGHRFCAEAIYDSFYRQPAAK